MIKIAPSILSADFSKLGDEVKLISQSNADYIHIDVMDGNFVDNITIGHEVIKSIRKYSNLVFDVHLMINNPDKHIKNFAEAGADIITVHAESSIHLDRTIKLIKSFGIKAGVSLVPSTHESVLEYIIDQIDLILVMTVNPGFGGQNFIPSQLDKISRIKKILTEKKLNIDLEVDGGINLETYLSVINAGANTLVSGSYIFKSNDYSKAILSLKNY
jgi:ribulose-phosphate 3-epimerase